MQAIRKVHAKCHFRFNLTRVQTMTSISTPPSVPISQVLPQVAQQAGTQGSFVEYIFTKPRWNWRILFGLHSSSNPYGHAGVHYSRPDGTSLLMNVSGSANSKLIYFFDPTTYLFGSQPTEGNQQGGVTNRAFMTLRINNVDQTQIDKMHEHYLQLAQQKQQGQIAYGLIFYQWTNPIKLFVNRFVPGYFNQPPKGNCAHWTSTGLVECGLMSKPSSWPLWIGFKLFLKSYWSHRENLSIISYQSINPDKYSERALIYPFYWLRNSYKEFWNLDNFANIIVECSNEITKDQFTVRKNITAFDRWKAMGEKFKGN
jgi:hypothetical protein